MTKDILSIPIFNINIERLFNTIRDVYYYYRNRLNGDTIEIIILVKWYKKLELLNFKKKLL